MLPERIGFLPALLLGALIVGCDDDDGDNATSSPPPTLETIVAYDVTAGEQPIDVTVLADGNLAVTLPFLGEVRVVTAADGAVLEAYAVPAPSGIVEDARGDLIVTTIPGVFDSAFDPVTQGETHGVSRLVRGEGSVTPLASFSPAVLNPDGTPDPEGVLARDVAAAADGTLYVSDLAGGRIFRIAPGGDVSLWSDSELLRGDVRRPGPAGRPPWLTGVNGMRLVGNALVATNTDFGRLVRFPIEPDGAAGAPEVLVEDERLLGLDEFEVASDGTVFAILAFRYELVRVSPEGEIEVIFGPTDGIDNPAGLSRGRGVDATDVFLTNLGFITDNAGDVARPGLLRVRNLFGR